MSAPDSTSSVAATGHAAATSPVNTANEMDVDKPEDGPAVNGPSSVPDPAIPPPPGLDQASKEMWKKRLTAGIQDHVDKEAVAKLNLGKTRGAVSDALKESGLGSVHSGPRAKAALSDQYSFQFTLAPSFGLTESLVNKAAPVAHEVFNELIDLFNDSEFVVKETRIFLHRFQGGYVSATKDSKATHHGWSFNDLQLCADDDNAVTQVLARIQGLLDEKEYPLSVERVSTRNIAPLRAYYFFVAPEGFSGDSESISFGERVWYQSFCDEYARQFPDAKVKKNPIILHPDEHENLKHVYFVAEIFYPDENQHLRDVAFNINPIFSENSSGDGSVMAHFALGDNVCFNCLHNGHMKSQCDPRVLRPPRDLVGAPHKYPSVEDEMKRKVALNDDGSFSKVNKLSTFELPDWKSKAITAQQKREKAAAEAKEKALEEERKAQLEQKTTHEENSSHFAPLDIMAYHWGSMGSRSNGNDSRYQRTRPTTHQEKETRHQDSNINTKSSRSANRYVAPDFPSEVHLSDVSDDDSDTEMEDDPETQETGDPNAQESEKVKLVRAECQNPASKDSPLRKPDLSKFKKQRKTKSSLKGRTVVYHPLTKELIKAQPNRKSVVSWCPTGGKRNYAKVSMNTLDLFEDELIHFFNLISLSSSDPFALDLEEDFLSTYKDFGLPELSDVESVFESFKLYVDPARYTFFESAVQDLN